MKSLSIDALPYPAAVIDSAYSILSTNSLFVELIGYENENMFLGLPIQAILYSHEQNEFLKVIEQHKDGKVLRASLIHSQGYILDVKVRISTEPQSGGMLLLLEKQENSEHSPELIKYKLASALVAVPSYKDAYQRILETVTQYFGFEGGSLYLRRVNESKLELRFSFELSERFQEFLQKHNVKDWNSINYPLFFKSQSRENPISPLLQKQGVHSMLLIPVREDSMLSGVVVLFSFSRFEEPENMFDKIEEISSYLRTIFVRLNHEERLDRAEKLFRSLIHSMPSGVIVRDESEDIILYNLAAARLLSLQNDTSFDPNLLYEHVQIQHADGGPLALDDLPSIVSLREGRKIRNYDLYIIRENGTHRWLSVNAEPLFRAGQVKPYASVATLKDVTENRRILEEIERAKQVAEEANKSKSRFLANISHEIRTPLSGIMGMTDILLSSDLKKEQHEHLMLMKDAEESLLDIINKVLELSKIESGNIIIENNTFMLRTMVKKAILPLFMGKQSSELTLDIYIEDSVPDILIGDALRIQQVLANLVSNAIKFTERGIITVSVRLEKDEEHYASLCFAVQDTGIGIPENQQKRIFENFQQVDASFSKKHQGSGLGLSITKQIVEIMGGKIWVESAPMKGSTFSFTLSFTKGKSMKTNRSQVTDKNPAPAAELSILLAEDNLLNQKSISYFLKEMGHSVEVAVNGNEALKKVERNKFDLILMDVQMPVMNGLEATRKIRAAQDASFDTQIPIIALTAYAMKEEIHHILSSGMNAYVSKPLSREILAEAISSVFRNRDIKGKQREATDPESKRFQDKIPEIDIENEDELTDFNTFVQDYQGDLDIAKQLLELFYRDVPGRIRAIEEALEEHTVNSTVDEFHSLTNNLSAVRLYSLGNISRTLEREALRGNLEQVKQQFSAFKQELFRAVKQSQHYLSIIQEMLE